MPKLFHTHKSNLFGPLILLPVFLWVAYEEIIHSNFLYAIVSIIAWLLFALFVVNYWLQAIVLFVSSFVAFYFKYWWAGILLLLLSAYMINAAKFVERRGIATLGEFREKLPTAGQIIDLLQDKKKVKVFLIVLTVVGLVISFFIMQYSKAR